MKSDIGLHPVASLVDRMSLGAIGRMLVWLASSADRWFGSKGGRPAEASLDTLQMFQKVKDRKSVV